MVCEMFLFSSQIFIHNILVLLSRMIIHKLFCAAAKIQLHKFRFKEGVKLV